MDKNKHITVIIPAAGTGTRANYEKQFYPIAGRPLLSYTVEHFQRHPNVEDIIIATCSNYIEDLQKYFYENKFTKCFVIEGGTTRHRSIYNCIKHIENTCSNTKIIIIHDAVRPFLTCKIITNLILVTNLFGACGYTRPLVSTVVSKHKAEFFENFKSNSDNASCHYKLPCDELRSNPEYELNEEEIKKINYSNFNTQSFPKINKSNILLIKTNENDSIENIPLKIFEMDAALDRSSFFNSETPQAFNYDIIKAAYLNCSELDLDNGTECLALIQKYTNTKVKLIEGSDILWKITYPKDLILVKQLIEDQIRSERIFILNNHEKYNSFCSKLLAYFELSKKFKPIIKTDIRASELSNSSSVIIFLNNLLNEGSYSTHLDIRVLVEKMILDLNSYLLFDEDVYKYIVERILNNINEKPLEDNKKLNFEDVFILIIIDPQQFSEENLILFFKAFHQIAIVFPNFGISLCLLKLMSENINSFEMLETLIYSKRSVFNSQILHL